MTNSLEKFSAGLTISFIPILETPLFAFVTIPRWDCD